MAFVKATKSQAKLRMAFAGPPGAGKTMSALQVARHFGKVAVIDTECGSASKYAGVDGLDFDVQPVTAPYNPARVATFVKEAAEAKYDILVLDSLTPFWNDAGGCLDLAEQAAKAAQARGGKYDSFASWKLVTPIYQKMVDAILAAPLHIIVTLRAKQEHVLEQENGKNRVRRMGMSAEMRDNFAYALDVEGMMSMENVFAVGKTRCPELTGKVYEKPGQELAAILKTWLA